MNAPGIEQESTPERVESSSSMETAPSEPVARDGGPAPAAPLPIAVPSTPAPAVKDPARMKVERVLEDNLWEVYRTLPEGRRTKFRSRGEDLAGQMRAWLDMPKIRSGRVYDAVRKWLLMIPHVNTWFLRQEAKIKTDRWTALRRDRGGIAADADTTIDDV